MEDLNRDINIFYQQGGGAVKIPLEGEYQGRPCPYGCPRGRTAERRGFESNQRVRTACTHPARPSDFPNPVQTDSTC
jgi:hypothetical protein